MPDWAAITAQLGVQNATPTPVSGGDISAAWRLGESFLKTGPQAYLDMYSAEARSLEALAGSDTVRVPRVLGYGEAGESAFIALEWLQLERADAATEAVFGEQLASMHGHTSDRFGWHRDNTIGLTPQPNSWTDDWIEFLRDRRLGNQLRLAANNGFTGELQQKGGQLLKRLPVYFDGVKCVPSLLHGDLWGGNWAACDGQPVMYDPAAYYGDREFDLAMTRLFGGFGPAFYAAYESAWPLPPGHDKRRSLYQLYHVLDHLNFFGGEYLRRAVALMDELL